ncbi:MAG: T9SS type A sorting domain-containing protein [Bacteroidetes bacterium]|nr:MAG: T9SS type A sorting domain-containing protein [Bacteroidota bacterium]
MLKKKRLLFIARTIFIVVSVFFGQILSAQIPTYQLTLTNESQTSATTYEFDLYLLRTGATPLELSLFQFGLAFDTSIMNGGTLTASIVPGYSQLPANYTSGSVVIGLMNYTIGGVICRYFNAAAGALPPGGPGSGTLISNVSTGCNSPGTRIGRYRITNSVPFKANSSCKHSWSTAPGSQRTNTTVNAYIGSINTNITDPASNLGYTDSGTCIDNVVLNPQTPCAVFIATSTTSESCFASSDGSVTVTLSGSGVSNSGTYSLNGSAFASFTSNPFTLTGLPSGNHSIEVLTTTPCTAGPGTFNIGGPSAPSSSTQTISACDSYTWSANGLTYTSSGTYAFNGTQGSCPHTFNLLLTINSSTNSTSTRTECNSYTWPVNGTTYLSSGTYSYTGLNGSGCPLDATLNLTISNVTAGASPLASIVCFGDATQVSVSASGGIAPYTGTGTVSQNAGTSVYTVTDAAGCSASASLTLTQPSQISATLMTTDASCGIANGTASVNASGGSGIYTYAWSNGQTGSSASGFASGSHSLTITDNSTCSETFPFSIGGSGGQPDPAGAINGASGACVNQSGIVYSIPPVPNAVSYVWTLPTGVSGSSTSNSITLSFGPSYAGGFICVAGVNSCGQGTQSCFNIPVLSRRPSPPGFINGNVNPCGGNTYTYSIPPSANASSYTWTVTGSGASIVSGQGTSSIQVNIAGGFGQGTISVQPQNCIGKTAIRTLNITGIPSHNSSLFGPSNVCAGTDGIVYSISPVVGASSSNTWSASGQITIVSSTQYSCTLNFGAGFTRGTLSVTSSNACGSFTKKFIIGSKPAQPGLINGSSDNLCGKSGLAYSINTVPSATAYQWSVPSGAGITSNSGTSITVDFGPSFTGTGLICVSALNTCGKSLDRCFAVSARPVVASAITGNSNPCRSSTETFSILPVVGATNYFWNLSGGGAITSAGSGASINFSTALSSGAILSVQAENNCGTGPMKKKLLHIDFSCRRNSDKELEQSTFTLFPNPAGSSTGLNFYADSKNTYAMIMTNLSGQVIWERTFSSEIGLNHIEIELGDQAPGMYLLNLMSSGDQGAKLRLIIE